MRLKPGIFAYPLKVDRDFEITLLANLITLTPGTLSVDVSADRRTLFVHAHRLLRSRSDAARHRRRVRAQDHGGFPMTAAALLLDWALTAALGVLALPCC